MHRTAVLAASALLAAAGCTGPVDPPPPDPGPGAEMMGAWSFTGCAATLHVWLLPLDALAAQTPPDFPPTPYRPEDAADSLLGRLAFYLYDCPESNSPGPARGGSLLGLLGVRVTPPDDVAPPAEEPPWATMYLLSAFAAGSVQAFLDLSNTEGTPVTGSVAVEQTPVPDSPAASSSVEIDGEPAFAAEMQGIPGQVEDFTRPERYYSVVENETRWIDIDFAMTLWETEGRVDYAPGSAWAAAVGERAYDAALDHHAMTAEFTLVWASAPAPS